MTSFTQEELMTSFTQEELITVIEKCPRHITEKILNIAEIYYKPKEKINKNDLKNIVKDYFHFEDDIQVGINRDQENISRQVISRWLKKIDLSQKFKVIGEAKRIITSSKIVLEELGISHSEKVYQKALMVELTKSGFKNPQTEISVPLYYPTKPSTMDRKEAQKLGYVHVGDARIDIETDDWVLELKQIEKLNFKEKGQLYKYLQHTVYTKGLLINFNQKSGKIEWCFQTI